MEKIKFRNLVRKLDVDEERIDGLLEILPRRYHEEFIGEVIVDENSILSFNKVFGYYLDDIWEELSDEEIEKIKDVYFIIEL